MSLSKKSKIAIVVTLFLLITAYVVKGIIYKPHTTIDDMEVVYQGDASEFLEILKNEALKWQDKAVELSGTISSKDANGVMLNSNVYCQLKDTKDLSKLKEKAIVTLKGRVIGYDDLLEELKLDKTIIIKP